MYITDIVDSSVIDTVSSAVQCMWCFHIIEQYVWYMSICFGDYFRTCLRCCNVKKLLFSLKSL